MNAKPKDPSHSTPVEVSEGLWINVAHLNNWLKERPRDFAWSFSYLWAKFQQLRA